MPFEQKRILVTGGAGFIGSELIQQLTSQGTNVVTVDYLVNGRPESLRGVSRDRFQEVIADIRDSERVADSLRYMRFTACDGVLGLQPRLFI